MIKANLVDLGTDVSAKITGRGELVVGKLDFSSAYSTTATVINTGFNLITPQDGNCFVITDILIYADKNVGVNDATISIYTADSPTSTTVISDILTTEIKASNTRDVTGLNLLVTNGVWVNAKTDDNNVYFTLFGYYIKDCF
jgi:hypothetical protein